MNIMGIRQYKPVTPGRRAGSVSDFADITDRKKKPEKSLLQAEAQEGRPQQPGHRLHALPWRRPQAHVPHHRLQAPARTTSGPRWSAIEYDPNRSARIALIQYEDGEKAYILAPEGLKAGDKIMSGEEVGAARRQLHAAAGDPAGHERSTTWRCSRAAAASSAAAPAPAPR